MSDKPEKCTCGATLVENASFCHRCGRPAIELTPCEEEFTPTPPPPPIVILPPQALPIGFGNPVALRVATLMSLGIMMAQMIGEMLPVVNYLFFAWWLLAGWVAVRLYRRLTGLRLTIGAGARLGFLTGLLAFVFMAVFFSLAMASSAGRDMLDQMVKQNPDMSQVVNNPTMLGAVLLMVLVMVFAMVVGICAAGGALGAKFAPPPSPRTEPRA